MLSPLHRAVITDDVKAIAKLLEEKANLDDKNHLGFTARELAQLLGRKECQKLFGCPMPTSIKIQKSKEQQPKSMPLDEFEKYFDISYRPYITLESYLSLKTIIKNCPYILRSSWIAKENHNATKRFHDELWNGATAPVYIKWINPILQYGLFADEDIPSGTYVGEYTGLLRRLYRKHPDHNAYCMHYPTRWWSLNYYAVDSLYEGNVMRFANHSESPNMRPMCLIDRNLLHMVLIADHNIRKDTQLTFNYGSDYWLKRLPMDNA